MFLLMLVIGRCLQDCGGPPTRVTRQLVGASMLKLTNYGCIAAIELVCSCSQSAAPRSTRNTVSHL